MSIVPEIPPAAERLPRFAVIIPFFQKAPGILARTLSAVMVAAEGLDVQVIVVDDGTEIGTATDLDGLPEGFRSRIRIIRQANGGPGAARNTGLDNVPGDVDYIAFIDSDDSWAPQHLRRAAAALGAGYDFYFGDWIQVSRAGSVFRQCRFDAACGTPTRLPEIYRYSGSLADLVHGLCPLHLDTSVLSRRKLGHVRFPPEFRWAREDHTYFLRLSENAPHICFCTTVEAECGRGLNIYASTGWESPNRLFLLIDELRYTRAQLSDGALRPAQVDWHRRRLGDFREQAAACLLSWARKRRLRREHIRAAWQADKRVFLKIPGRIWIWFSGLGRRVLARDAKPS